MDEKDKLLALKQNQVFESVQKENQIRRKELAESFGHKGILHSGPHARAIVDLEIICLKKLLDARLQILLEVYYKNSKPWTDYDELLLSTKIEEYYSARSKASKDSLLDYFTRRGLQPISEYFEHEAASVFSDIKREIKIVVLENRIDSQELPDKDVGELITSEESNQLEFKSTFQWDITRQAKNEKLRMEVISTIAAFNNTDGGYILIGIEDNGNIFGLERDYSLLKNGNRDGFEQMLVQEIENRIARSFLPKVTIAFREINSKDVCSIKINIGEDAVWVKEDNSEKIYIRTHNSTRSLSPRESADYIRKKWRPKA